MKNWMVYDAEAGAEFFETEGEAIACAEERLCELRTEARSDGWAEWVEDISVLKVVQRATMVNKQEIDKEEDPDSDWEFTCDFEMTPISDTEAA